MRWPSLRQLDLGDELPQVRPDLRQVRPDLRPALKPVHVAVQQQTVKELLTKYPSVVPRQPANYAQASESFGITSGARQRIRLRCHPMAIRGCWVGVYGAEGLFVQRLCIGNYLVLSNGDFPAEWLDRMNLKRDSVGGETIQRGEEVEVDIYNPLPMCRNVQAVLFAEHVHW